MTEIHRKAYMKLVDVIANIHHNLSGDIGNINTNPKVRLGIEALLARLRGASIYHDEQIAERTQLTFGTSDKVEFGTYVGQISSFDSRIGNEDLSILSAGLPYSPETTPRTWLLDGPSSPEGWKVWCYNTWAYYNLRATVLSGSDDYLDNRNTSSVVEPNSADRLAYPHPVRWTGTEYEQVHLWSCARHIALHNTTGDDISAGDEYKINLPLNFFDGCNVYHPVTANDLIDGGEHTISIMPKDFTIVCYDDLYVDDDGEYISQPDDGNLPEQVDDFRLYFDTNTNKYVLCFDLNTASTWADESHKIITIYFGDQDQNEYVGPDYNIDESDCAQIVDEDVQVGVKKSFFNDLLSSYLWWQPHTINDSQPYLIAKKRINGHLTDGVPVFIDGPNKYILDTTFVPSNNNGATNALNGLAELAPHQVCGVVFAAQSNGNSNALNYNFYVGPVCEAIHYQSDWDNFEYFPSIPHDYIPLASFIIRGAPDDVKDIVMSSPAGKTNFIYSQSGWASASYPTLSNNAVVWYKQHPPLFASAPLASDYLTQHLLQSLYDLTVSLRSMPHNWINKLAHYLITVYLLNVNDALYDRADDFKNPNQLPSTLWRESMKYPQSTTLANGYPVAMQFNDKSRQSIYDFSGQSSSTELIRFDSVNLVNYNKILPSDTPLEIYLDNTNQCLQKSSKAGGSGTVRDYTLRLNLKYENGNVLMKDWYLMASKYFLGDAEYNRRKSSGQTVAGYFKRGTLEEQQSKAKGTLATINEWVKHGYAGIVPDLKAGESRPLYTRQAAPNTDYNRPPTEAEFRQQYKQQGYSDGQIDDFVRDYLDNGGVFYIIDLRQHPAKFQSIESCAINVTEYTFSTQPYWHSNLPEKYGLTDQQDDLGLGLEDAVDDYTEVRADSFTVAPSGLSAGVLEHRYFIKDSGGVIDDNTLNQPLRSSVYRQIYTNTGLLLQTSKNNTVSNIGVPLGIELKTGFSQAQNSNIEGVKLTLYAHDTTSGLPSTTLLAESTLIPYTALPIIDVETPGSASHVYFSFESPVILPANNTYWAEVQLIGTLQGGVLVVDSNTQDGDTAPSATPLDPIGDGTPLDNIDWLVRSYGDHIGTGSQWHAGLCVPYIQLFATSSTDSSNKNYYDEEDSNVWHYWKGEEFAIPIEYNANADVAKLKIKIKSLLFDSNESGGFTNGSSDYIRAEIRADNSSVPTDDAIVISGDIKAVSNPISMSQIDVGADELTFTWEDDNVLTLTSGTQYWLVLKKYSSDTAQVEIKGGTLLLMLREDSATKLGYTAQYFDSEWHQCGGRSQLKFVNQSYTALAAFNRKDVPNLPGPNTHREASNFYIVDGHWSWTSTKLPTQQAISAYPRAVYSDSEYEWVEPNSDIYFVVRKLLDGDIVDVHASFRRNPAWRCLFKSSSPGAVQSISSNFQADYDQFYPVVQFINVDSDNIGVGESYESYKAIPLSEDVDHYQMRCYGVFSPALSGRHYYYLRATCRDGVKLYVAGDIILNEWNINSTIQAHTSSKLLLTNGTFYPIQLDHFVSRASDETNEDTPLLLQWFTHGWEETWTLEDNSTEARVVQEQSYDGSTYTIPATISDDESYNYILKHYLSLIPNNVYKWVIILPQAFTLTINGILIDADTVASVGFEKISLVPTAGGGDEDMSDSSTLTEEHALTFTIDPTIDLYEFIIEGSKDEADTVNDRIVIDSYIVDSGDIATEQQTLAEADNFGIIGPETSYSASSAGPIALGNADGIAYLGVSKTANALSDANYGAPLGDQLIVRSV